MHVTPRTILCVDDDADDQLMVFETIKEINPDARVATAINGLEALHFLANARTKEELPCLIIMDINMPLMDGKETVARIKKEPRYDGIPIVLFTTSSSQLDRTFCEQYNIPFITKPLSPKELHNVVKGILALANG
jgi:CheY-like chemotaxis protein